MPGIDSCRCFFRFGLGISAGTVLVALASPLAAEVPAGTEVQVRLLTLLSSYTAKAGQDVRGVVIAPLMAEGGVAVPAGSILSGHVNQTRRVGLGFVHETARLSLSFDELELPGGPRLAVLARLTAVDNARERVDRRGRIRGVRATASISHRLWYRLAGMALNRPFGLGGLFVLDNTAFRFPDPEIHYAPGTEMRLVLEQPLPLDGGGAYKPPHSAGDMEELERLVAPMPYWSYSKRQGAPIDMTNLVYIGSKEALERAFVAAGWTGSRSLSAWAGFRITKAVFEDRGYATAPMRTLLVDGAEAEMTWQKALNTFEKRHHLRIWRREEEWRSQPVWLSSATWDVGTGFSFRYGLNHTVERNADIERDKVANDLLLTGCVDSVAYVRRPEITPSAEEADRGMRTDGKIAALFLNDCRDPRYSRLGAQDQLEPGRLTRFTRRLTLTTRNHFLRDNIVWKAGEGAVFSYRLIRKWRRPQAAARKPAGERPQGAREQPGLAGSVR